MICTPQQDAACLHVAKSPRNLALKARAGSGKSATILEMIKRCSSRDRVLVVTFNKENQLDMANKVPRRVDVKTCHALGYAAVQSAWLRKVETDDQRERSLARTIVPAPKPTDGYNHRAAVAITVKVAQHCMDMLAGTIEEIEDVIRAYGVLMPKGLTKEAVCGWVLVLLAEVLKETSAISYADMVYIAAKENFRTGNYHYVFFDEFQDANPAQRVLVRNALAEGGKLVLVGDDRQAIYGFRGAGAGACDEFIASVDAEVLPLSMTFRCPEWVVELCKPLVDDFMVSPEAPDGRLTWDTEEDMYAQVQPGHSVIARSNYWVTRVAMGLLKRGIRAKIVGRDFEERLTGMIESSGATTVTRLLEWMSAYVTTENERLVAAGKDEEAAEIADAADALKTLSDGMVRVSELQTKLQSLFVDDEGTGFVRVSTVHKAKGFQWNDVWMIESSFKLNKVEEENLYYVAATRTLWTADHPGHLHLVQCRRKDGSFIPSLAKELLSEDHLRELLGEADDDGDLGYLG